jgi:hypothetical protein
VRAAARHALAPRAEKRRGALGRSGVAALAALVALVALTASPSAEAYCLATTCGSSGVVCEPATPDDCGTPLRWQRDCVGVSLHELGPPGIEREAAREAMRAAFGAWLGADCGEGAGPGLGVVDLGDVTCDRVEYNGDAGNSHTVLFRSDAWPYPESPLHLGLTTVVFDTETGEIFDADIELNATFPLTTGEPIEYDLVSVLTHEAGHFLGLAHAAEPDATMFFSYEPGTTELRSLHADDVAGVCEAYPPRPIDTERCNPIPRHGFSELCGDEQRYASCSLASRSPSAAREGGPAGALEGLVVALALASLTARTVGRGSCARPRARGPRRGRSRSSR